MHGNQLEDVTVTNVRSFTNNSPSNTTKCTSFFAVALRPNAGHGLLILEVARSHTTTHHNR